MATTPQDLLDRAAGKDLEKLLRQGFGGTLLAISTALISGILTVADLFIKPMDALARALGDMVWAIFGAPPQVVIAGAEASVDSLLGPWGLGPFTLPLAIGVVLLSLFLVNVYVSSDRTTNVPALMGTGLDIITPDFISSSAEEEDEEID